MRRLLRFAALGVLVFAPFTACMDFGGGEESSGCESMSYDLCLFGDCACSGVVCPDDGNPCTTSYCSGGRCYTDVRATGTACTDGGLDGVCISGVCSENLCKDVRCDDEPCSTGECDYRDGLCDYTPRYSDGTACFYDGMDGVCVGGVCGENLCKGVVCDDGDACTKDTCDYVDGSCTHEPSLPDGTPCAFGELEGVCVDGVCGENLCEGVVCDDGEPCTNDSCDYGDGSCVRSTMEDGEPCTLEELVGHCVDGVCIAGTGGTGGVGGDTGFGGAGGYPGLRHVFVTSELIAGNEIGGLAGADAFCQRLADAAGLEGTYMAWLSDDEETPRQRFTLSNGPYVRLDGRLIAHDWPDLISSSPANPIEITEKGTHAPETDEFCSFGRAYVFTGTSAKSWSEGRNCGNWGTGGPNEGASLGLSDSTYFWSAQCFTGSDACELRASLYCFGQ